MGLGDSGAYVLFASAPVAVLWWTVSLPGRERWSDRRRFFFRVSTLVLGAAPMLTVALGHGLRRRDWAEEVQGWKEWTVPAVIAAQVVSAGVFIGIAKGARTGALAASMVSLALGFVFGLLAVLDIAGV